MKGFFQMGNPFMEISVEGRKIAAMVDTGFNGSILLPQPIIDEMALDKMGVTDYLSASGEECPTGVYRAYVQLLGKEKEVSVFSTDAYFALAGMDLMHDCKLTVERSKDLVEIDWSK